MAIKYTNFFHSKTLHNLPKLGFLVWKYDIWQPSTRYAFLSWGRCYDHNFLRFCHFSAKKLAFFSKTNVMIKILEIIRVVWAKNANIFAKFFGENIFEFITSVPGSANAPLKLWTWPFHFWTLWSVARNGLKRCRIFIGFRWKCNQIGQNLGR
jgi:hypothetical protein